MRISGKKDVSTEIAAIVSDPAAHPVFENNADNGTMEYLPSAPNQFPLHTERVGSFDEFRLSKTLGDKLMEFNDPRINRSEEHTSELQSLMRISYAVFCLQKKKNTPKRL